jgi:thymidylate synthase
MSLLRDVNAWEIQYLDLMRDILFNGSRQKNRTGIDSFMIPGAMIKADLRFGFPAITTKKLAWKAVVGELLGFLRGYTSAAQFRELGCKIWDQNANENKAWLANPHRQGEDDLGYIYSRLWTDMPHHQQYAGVDDNGPYPAIRWNQIQKLIENIQTDPTSRRLIVNSWHPEVFDQAALPPCHVMFQVLIDQSKNLMHMSMYQRSCDMFLGVPFNIASYALLTHILCLATGYTPGTFTWFGADCHIYENHVEQVKEQLGREPYGMPGLVIPAPLYLETSTYEDIFKMEPDQFTLYGYKHHEPIKAPMAV